MTGNGWNDKKLLEMAGIAGNYGYMAGMAGMGGKCL